MMNFQKYLSALWRLTGGYGIASKVIGHSVYKNKDLNVIKYNYTNCFTV